MYSVDCEHFEESNSKIHNGMLLLASGPGLPYVDGQMYLDKQMHLDVDNYEQRHLEE